jgi:hypothetical protein
VGKSEKKTLLGIPRSGKEDNIDTDRQEMGWQGGGGGGMASIDLAEEMNK